ncbi:GUN4 domain protein [Thalassoporum mexicanum PCC 7367]|uniref:GUN4 domain-containing protein n=1 Tax=Thalassoporum mexicanum TaxID=3457544 RepID=UPI00029FF6C6|nr:GUN4 domain-containing protein [Pseudanabaena sp. PCC 7367]AFY70483.1 GUN4 domain protein [Pseudanabaena sp. PCC 7367]
MLAMRGKLLVIGGLVASLLTIRIGYAWYAKRNGKCPEDMQVCAVALTPLAKPRLQLNRLKQIQFLLSQREWNNADRLTTELLELLATERDAELKRDDPASMGTALNKAIACTDLHQIDRLWAVASDGKYGISMQKQIWDDLPNQSIAAMSQRVGWDAQDVDYVDQVKQTEPVALLAGQLPSIGRQFFGVDELGQWYSRHDRYGSEYPIPGPDPTSTSDWCCQEPVVKRLSLCGF